MSAENLPWESLKGPVYYAQELKPRKPGMTKACWGMAIFLIIGGIITPYRIATIFGVLYVLTLLMKKDTVVTERGVEIFYQMRITTHYDFWEWKDISSVIREDKNDPKLVALYFTRGDRNKRLFFKKADAAQIMILARKKNPRAVVSDAAPVKQPEPKKKKNKK